MRKIDPSHELRFLLSGVKCLWSQGQGSSSPLSSTYAIVDDVCIHHRNEDLCDTVSAVGVTARAFSILANHDNDKVSVFNGCFLSCLHGFSSGIRLRFMCRCSVLPATLSGAKSLLLDVWTCSPLSLLSSCFK